MFFQFLRVEGAPLPKNRQIIPPPPLAQLLDHGTLSLEVAGSIAIPGSTSILAYTQGDIDRLIDRHLPELLKRPGRLTAAS